MNNTNRSKATKTQTGKQAAAPTESSVKAETIKLGIDVHLDRYVVVRITDGGTPQPPQRFEPVAFMLWVARQLTLARKVFTCYEAGPFGYTLHRRLEMMGITNYVVRPRAWDEYGKKVKTDKRDAKELALRLGRYVGGNHDAFCVVRVPTPEQEQERSISRQRESFQRERQRLAAQGRSHGLYYGEHLQGEWWQEDVWQAATGQLPPMLVNLLEPLRRLMAVLEVELKARAQEVEAAATVTGFDFSGVDKPQNETGLYGLRYAEFVVPLVKAVQEQQSLLRELGAEIEMQKLEIEKLSRQNVGMEGENAALKSQLYKITAALQGAGITVEK